MKWKETSIGIILHVPEMLADIYNIFSPRKRTRMAFDPCTPVDASATVRKIPRMMVR